MGNFCSSLSSKRRDDNDDDDDGDDDDDDDDDDDGIPRSEEELRKRYFKQDHRKDGGGVGRTKAETHCAYMLPRLKHMAAAAAAAAEKTTRLQILDVGCGSGEITIDIAEMFPDARVIGMDVSGAGLDSARKYAEKRGVMNVEFVRKSVYDVLADGEGWRGRFDVVYTHQVVAHWGDGDRVRGMREMMKVTRKGGVLCMREGDLRTGRFYPEGRYVVLEECFGVILAVHEAVGGSTDAGRQLEHWVMEAGAGKKNVVVSNSVSRYDTREGRRGYGGHWPGRCMQGFFAQRAMQLGVSRERLEEYALAWREWMEDEDGMFVMMHGEVEVVNMGKVFDD